MTKLSTRAQKLQRNLPLIAGMLLCIYFSFHTLYGARNYERLQNLETISHIKKLELTQIEAQKNAIESKVTKMRPVSLSPDMLEEQVRSILGYQHENEIFVIEISSLHKE